MTRDADPLEALRRALDDYADGEAEALLGEALAEARAKVRSVLVDAVTERLLEQARAQLGDARDARAGKASRARPQKRSGTEAETSPDPRPSAARKRSRRERSGARAGTSRQRAAATASSASGTDAENAVAADGLYVYCVVEADAEIPELAGIDGVHPLVAIREHELAAVASAVSLQEFGEAALEQRFEDLEWLERNARTHEYVLDRVREHATLVPMRMCTIYRGEASVQEMLSREHEFLADALARLAGTTEWGVKIFLREDHDLSPSDGEEAAEAAREHAEAGPGESYLLRRRRAQQREQDAARVVQECAEDVHARLSSAAVEARLNPLQPAELTNRAEAMALNGVYLVEDAESDAFNAVVAELRNEYGPHGAELELTGPWPPYNFVNSSSEVGR